MVEGPVAGLHYPTATGEFMTWFSTDADCLDYLEWLRWPAGFVCPECGQGGWRLGDGRFECSGCGRRTSVTAGTMFDRTRTPLTVWFTPCWQFAAAKDGISALSLQRSLEIGSYQTAWAMLHRLRSVLVRPGRERLTGAADRGGRGRRDLHGWRGARPARRPGQGQEAAGRHRGGAAPTPRTGALPDGRAPRRQDRHPPDVPRRSRRGGRHRHHRRLAALPSGHRRPLRPPAPPRRRPRGEHDPARRTPGRLVGQAVATRHPPGLHGRRPPAQLP